MMKERLLRGDAATFGAQPALRLPREVFTARPRLAPTLFTIPPAIVAACGLAAVTIVAKLIFEFDTTTFTLLLLLIVSQTLLFTCCMIHTYLRLRATRYTVTDEYLEVEEAPLWISSGFENRIPFANIRHITSSASFIQRRFGVGDVTVHVAQHSLITLRDVSDSKGKRDLLWQLVTDYLRLPTRRETAQSRE